VSLYRPNSGLRDTSVHTQRDQSLSDHYFYSRGLARLRVRIGISYGTCRGGMDAVTKGWDFYGNVVNMGARVEAAGHGGQILITGDAYNALLGGEMSHDSKKCFSSEDPTLPEGMKRELGILNVKHHGEIQLRGLSSPTPLLEIVPDQISPRAFPPLRVDLNVRMESEDIRADLVHASPEEQLDGSIRLSMKAAGVFNYDDVLMSDVRGLQCNIKCLLSLYSLKEKHDLLVDL